MGTTTKKVTSKRRSKKPPQADFERGKIVEVTLRQPFTLNGNRITHAKIEIDHINFGLDKKTFKLNSKKRSDFTVSDIEKFLLRLDGEYILVRKVKGRKLRYELRIDSPIPGKNFEKTYLMVFETDFDKQHLVHTITLFRVGN